MNCSFGNLFRYGTSRCDRAGSHAKTGTPCVSAAANRGCKFAALQARNLAGVRNRHNPHAQRARPGAHLADDPLQLGILDVNADQIRKAVRMLFHGALRERKLGANGAVR